jgi:Vesicle coat protein involved in Golgi to plasma membrane transport
VEAEPPTYFWSPVRPTSAGLGATSSVGDTDRCASCRMSLPDDAQPSTPLRTKEDVHVCGVVRAANEDHVRGFAPGSLNGSVAAHREDSCHNHQLVYRSSPSPVDAESFASLRRATVRTLSGEQLPRGQTSGPLWFGDPVSGYTVAYVFRLADLHARGRQRYYALLALAGHDTTRAFVACTLIWDLFEQISSRIIRSAEAVAAKSIAVDESPPTHGQITPVSSFLTGRTTDPDGFPRRGMATWRANGIAELVDNDAFFCELHMLFVSMLQELGRSMGGMRVRPARAAVAVGETLVTAAAVEETEEETEHTVSSSPRNGVANGPNGHATTKFSVPPATFDLADSSNEHSPYSPSICSPGLIDTRQQVVV